MEIVTWQAEKTASVLLSLFHSDGKLRDIASKQQKTGMNKSENSWKASCLSTHLVGHISFNFFLFSPTKISFIQVSKAKSAVNELLRQLLFFLLIFHSTIYQTT